jgi:hypothetical protein
VARQPDLPRSLRRAAARAGGPRGRRPSAQLQAAADAGVLTRSNTAPGTAGRRAVDRAIYERRRAAGQRRGAPTARAALGHETPTQRPTITALVEVPGGIAYLDFAGLGRRDRARIARHDALIGQLVGGTLAPSAFRRRVRGWVPLATGHRLASDRTAVLAAVGARREAGEDMGPYPERGTP